MPLPDPTYVAACFCIPLAFALGCALGFLFHRARLRVAFGPGSAADEDTGSKRCLYCRVGEALLLDETIRIESGEMVETKRFVCAACGLPQWVVTRSRVMGPASR